MIRIGSKRDCPRPGTTLEKTPNPDVLPLLIRANLPPISEQETLSMPWGKENLNKAFSTGRSLKYLQYCLDRALSSKPRTQRYLNRMIAPNFYPAGRKSGLRKLQDGLRVNGSSQEQEE